MTMPTIIKVNCSKCGNAFYPYGDYPTIPPVADRLQCPECNYVGTYIFDQQLQRESIRKALGLEKKVEEKIKMMELENKQLRMEIDRLKEQTEENGEIINELKTRVGKLIPEIRKQVAEAISEIVVANKSGKKSAQEIA